MFVLHRAAIGGSGRGVIETSPDWTLLVIFEHSPTLLVGCRSWLAGRIFLFNHDGRAQVGYGNDCLRDYVWNGFRTARLCWFLRLDFSTSIVVVGEGLG